MHASMPNFRDIYLKGHFMNLLFSIRHNTILIHFTLSVVFIGTEMILLFGKEKNDWFEKATAKNLSFL